MAEIATPVGAATLAGKVASVRATGITLPVPSATQNSGFKVANKSLTAYNYSKTYAADGGGGYPPFALNVKEGIGYIPGGVTVVAFSVRSDDLDSGTPALVQSIYIGDTELVTGITTGQAGTNGFFPCVPTNVTAPTAVYLKTTTVPATAAAGTVNVTAYYYSS